MIDITRVFQHQLVSEKRNRFQRKVSTFRIQLHILSRSRCELKMSQTMIFKTGTPIFNT